MLFAEEKLEKNLTGKKQSILMHNYSIFLSCTALYFCTHYSLFHL